MAGHNAKPCDDSWYDQNPTKFILLLMRKLSRLHADALLFFTACIWGFAFVAQKQGMAVIAPMAFVGVRFLLSSIVVAPMAAIELRANDPGPQFRALDWAALLALLCSFTVGAGLQQVGLLTATVTSAGFLTITYVVFVPILTATVFRGHQHWLVWPACAIALFGVYLLNGAAISRFSQGDWLLAGCAICFAFQIILLGIVVRRTRRPFLVSLLQNLVCAGTGLIWACAARELHWASLVAYSAPILYAGLVSGGLGFAIQAFAQQHTPTTHASIIMSTEALFAAIGGVLLLGEQMDFLKSVGCALIFGAILIIQFSPSPAKSPNHEI